MSRMDRYRMKNKYSSGLDALSGDAETTQLATSGVAELLKNVGAVAAASQAKKEAAQKTAADKAAADAQAKKADDADKAAAEARNKATSAANDARLAALKAQQEKEPYGPLHLEAQKAADVAAMRDSEARNLEAKAAALHPGASSQFSLSETKASKSSLAGMFSVRNVAIGLGVLVAGVVGYKLITRNSAPPSRGYRGGR
jgi:hypothetical protein